MTVRRILTVFGTRPEAIKLFPLLHALEGDSRFASIACVSAQHRGMLDQVLAWSASNSGSRNLDGLARAAQRVQAADFFHHAFFARIVECPFGDAGFDVDGYFFV